MYATLIGCGLSRQRFYLTLLVLHQRISMIWTCLFLWEVHPPIWYWTHLTLCSRPWEQLQTFGLRFIKSSKLLLSNAKLLRFSITSLLSFILLQINRLRHWKSQCQRKLRPGAPFNNQNTMLAGLSTFDKFIVLEVIFLHVNFPTCDLLLLCLKIWYHNW